MNKKKILLIIASLISLIFGIISSVFISIFFGTELHKNFLAISIPKDNVIYIQKKGVYEVFLEEEVSEISNEVSNIKTISFHIENADGKKVNLINPKKSLSYNYKGKKGLLVTSFFAESGKYKFVTEEEETFNLILTEGYKKRLFQLGLAIVFINFLTFVLSVYLLFAAFKKR